MIGSHLDPRDAMPPEDLDALDRVFSEQLVACLEECMRGRRGLFQETVGEENAWPEAARLRELAVALQGVNTVHEKRNPLCDEFLELCTISGGTTAGRSISARAISRGMRHAEPVHGERGLARAFLERIEKGEAGTPMESDKKV
jgi:hypothetical protein